MSSPDPVVQRLYIALGTLLAVIVALVTGGLARADGAAAPGAMLMGGGAFGGTLALVLAVMDTLRR